MFKEAINVMTNEEIVELIQAQESMIARDNGLIFDEEWQIKKLAETLAEVANLLRSIRDHERQRLSLFEQTEHICRKYDDKMPHITWPGNSDGRTDPNNCKACELTYECDHHICLKAVKERRTDEE